MNQNVKNPDELMRSSMIIWAAFLVAPLLYLYLAYILTTSRTDPAEYEHIRLLGYGFAVLSLVGVVVAYIIWNKLPRKMLTNRYQSIKTNPGNTEDENRAIKAAVISQTMAIITFAFCESCCIYGMVLVILGEEFMAIIPFVALSVISMLLFRPTKVFFDRVAVRLEELRLFSQE